MIGANINRCPDEASWLMCELQSTYGKQLADRNYVYGTLNRYHAAYMALTALGYTVIEDEQLTVRNPDGQVVTNRLCSQCFERNKQQDPGLNAPF
jgi:hypothetical protein